MLRRLAAALASVVLMGALTACNDDSNGSSSDGSGQSSDVATLTKDNFADEIQSAQSQAGSAHIEATIESQGQSLNLDGDVENLDTPETPAFSFTADTGGQELKMIVVDQVLYVSGAGLGAEPGKPWAKIDVSDSTNPIGQLFQAANPGNFAAYLEGVTKFEDKGDETVDGVDTHHYDVTVDTATMLKSNPVFQGQEASALGLPESLTSEVYVDDDNLPVEIKVDLAAAGAFEVHFSDYGKDVSIKAPPADQVSDVDLGGN
jgi:LppX_LprAFG lipoprotein